MDLVLRNARVCTSDEQNPWADTVVVRDGRFAFVGREADWRADPTIPTHDLGGSLVLPGLIDSHTHPSAVAASDWHVRLPWTDDVDEILEFIRAFGEAHPLDGDALPLLRVLPDAHFAARQPTKELLDSAISDRPCLCQDFSEHEHWVNSRMLELMGVTKRHPRPGPGSGDVRPRRGRRAHGPLSEKAYAHFLDRMYDKLGWTPPER